ncbi:MAG: hypothetical protein H7141_13340 [Burkholderiales bacterium]|nr:hypothetical protein [Bacteroidia bacterium]
MKLLLNLFTLILLSSCVKDKPQEPVKTAVSVNAETKVLITNEGNYGWGLGTISLYDPYSGSVIDKYDQQQNGGATLGNVCQSIAKHNNHYYIVINNSNKIVVVNASDFVRTAIITGFNSPRYFLPITYNKAYVSDLYASSVQVVDLNSNTITGSIPCTKGTEEMVLIYNKAFITNTNSDYCYVVNTTTDVLTDSINVGKGSSSICIDKYSKVWVLSRGNSTQAGNLSRINPVTLQVEQSLNFNLGDIPNKLCINKTHDTLYYLNNGVCQFQISSSILPASKLISEGSKNFYGLGVNPKDYTIYVSDAINYNQKSKIEIYKPNGSFITNFNGGIISNDFMFE